MKFISVFFLLISSLVYSSYANATIIYNIEVRGSIVGEPYTTGSFLDSVGSNFGFFANFHLDVGEAISSRVNWEGYEVWELGDPSLNLGSLGCIRDGRDPRCVGTSSVEIEFQDSRSEKWASNPDFAFLGLTEDDVSYDIIGVGMPMSDTTRSLEYYMFLVFEDGLFDGYSIDGLPKIIDMNKLQFAAAEFYQEDTHSRGEGFARLDISTLTLTQIAEVPEPSSLAIFALGMMGLASRKMNKKA